MSEQVRFLMCPPDHYEVDYVINPWMEGNVHRSSRALAAEQWRGLYEKLRVEATIELVTPERGWPDMVFTANAGLIHGRQVVLSRFLHPERQGEEPHFRRWFADAGYTVHELPEDLPFEGAGDALLDRAGRWLWAGYGPRTELETHPLIARWLDLEVISLRLMDKRFYHLDTCFCPLEGGWLLYYPQAFDAYSNGSIERRVPAEKRIVVSEPDAVSFACNSVNVGRLLFVNQVSEELRARLEAAGFTVIQTPLTEFLKAGGAAKCLTLRVNEPVRAEVHALATVETRVVKLEGHLLDSKILDRALDTIVEGGGSFKIQQFELGRQRQSTSTAEIKVSAPSAEVLEKILSELIPLGTLPAEGNEGPARLEPVAKAGVAPADFYVTTIYPTEVRIGDAWLRVENQRMDGVIVIQEGRPGEPPRAACKLLRDLELGEQLVVGVEGIRSIRRKAGREFADTPPEEEFGFMGAGVSSERKVELVVEQIAWEMRQIREHGGRVVVVAGPVVIHTGGGDCLAKLVRDGYVQALLAGNALAVHDIEQALMGTSLGVDMRRGVSVHGGHRHHLKGINTIRQCGSIAAAVEQGVLRSGIFYDCVKMEVPFVLAGSIRDDGPLPDTRMDLIQAQEEYAAQVREADMILMLSSMLHSIGVGNMTPAGVRLVCVDINPAVVTKLSDRGSVESVGVVTDVGLFLSRLVLQLDQMQTVYRPA